MFPAVLIGPLVKVGFYLIGAVLAAGLVLGAYAIWKRGIVADAQQKIIVEQLEQALEQAKLAAEQMKRLQDLTDRLSWELTKQKAEMNKKLDDIEAEIDATAEDRPASDVLKETVKKLGGQ